MIAQFLSRRPQLAAIVSNAGWLIGERAFTLLTGFAVNVWFVRYLGPEQYGSYAYALSYTALFAAIASLGLETIVIRDLAKEPERAGDILGTALAIRGMAGAAAYLLIVASSVVLARGPGSLSLIAIVAGSSLFQGVGVFDYWFQANVSARPAVIARATVTLATHAVRCGLIVLGAPLAAFAVVLVASAAAATAAVYLVFRRHARTGSLAYQKDVARALLRDAWPLVIAGIAVNVYMRIDQVMLGNMTTAEETGIYAVAVNLSELWWIFPGTVMRRYSRWLSERERREIRDCTSALSRRSMTRWPQGAMSSR